MLVCYYLISLYDHHVGVTDGNKLKSMNDWGGSSPSRVLEFFSSPPHPDWLWDPPCLSNGYQGLFP